MDNTLKAEAMAGLYRAAHAMLVEAAKDVQAASEAAINGELNLGRGSAMGAETLLDSINRLMTAAAAIHGLNTPTR